MSFMNIQTELESKPFVSISKDTMMSHQIPRNPGLINPHEVTIKSPLSHH